MNITAYLSTHAKEQIAEAFGRLLDDGTVFIYDGDQPSPDGKIIDQRVLVEATLPSPAFDPVDNCVMRGSHIGISKKAIATGHASWAECLDRFGNVILRGPAGVGDEFFCDLSWSGRCSWAGITWSFMPRPTASTSTSPAAGTP